ALARDLVAHDAGLSIRHHGDFHLGQVLRAADGEWIIIDFEGEPTRPLAARRALHSPLRDVAGMQRSFAYAASSGATEVGGLGADARVESRAARWERDARAAFLEGYFGSSPVPHVQGLLPDSRESATALLTLFEVEKVFYELDYELNNRPSWAWIPLRGIAKLF
ncbi:MAG: alpha-amylase, partial [Gemmatimonadaceae bacterium]